MKTNFPPKIKVAYFGWAAQNFLCFCRGGQRGLGTDRYRREACSGMQGATKNEKQNRTSAMVIEPVYTYLGTPVPKHLSQKKDVS